MFLSVWNNSSNAILIAIVSCKNDFLMCLVLKDDKACANPDGGEGTGGFGPPALENHKWLYVSFKILVWTHSRSNLTHSVQ